MLGPQAAVLRRSTVVAPANSEQQLGRKRQVGTGQRVNPSVSCGKHNNWLRYEMSKTQVANVV